MLVSNFISLEISTVKMPRCIVLHLLIYLKYNHHFKQIKMFNEIEFVSGVLFCSVLLKGYLFRITLDSTTPIGIIQVSNLHMHMLLLLTAAHHLSNRQ